MNLPKTENLIEGLPEGYANYVKVCIDPYHDRTIRFEGAPTSRSATSVCLCYNQEQTYSAADFGILPATPTWDAHFAMFPFLNSHQVDSGIHSTASGSPTLTPGFQSYTLYPMTVNGVPSGTPTYAYSTSNTSANFLGLSTNSLTTFISNPSADDPSSSRTLRIVGEAFEVIDESPDIYQQGSVTVYRYPLDTSLTNINVYYRGLSTDIPVIPYGAPPATSLDMNVQSNSYVLRTPPSNTSSAVLVSGSETWKAKEGAYVIGTQSISEIPFNQVDNTPIHLLGVCPSTQPNNPAGSYSLIDRRWQYQVQGEATVGTGFAVPFPDSISPFNLSGAYFTGLSTQYATLRLRYRLYVEILTDPSDNTLTPLASPTLPFNEAIQEMVMQVLSQLPAGCPQTMNPKGEWWKKVLHKVGRVAEDLAGPLSTLSPEVGLILQGGGRLLSNSTRPKGEQKKKDKPASTTPKSSPKPGAKVPGRKMKAE